MIIKDILKAASSVQNEAREHKTAKLHNKGAHNAPKTIKC